VRQTAFKAALNKVAKHEKTCFENQYIFILFAFDTFDFLVSDVVDLLQRVHKITHSNVVSHRSMNVLFKRIDFAIHKRLAA
jgi:hypothetical protein